MRKLRLIALCVLFMSSRNLCQVRSTAIEEEVGKQVSKDASKPAAATAGHARPAESKLSLHSELSAQHSGTTANCFDGGAFATFCNGYGFFTSEYTGTVEACLLKCKDETHPAPEVQCYGVEYSHTSAHCYFYGREEVERCGYEPSVAYQAFTYVGCQD